MTEHRWSGWPGAVCLNCGSSDPDEEALAHDCMVAKCSACGELWPQRPTKDCRHVQVEFTACAAHQPTKCPAVGGSVAVVTDDAPQPDLFACDYCREGLPKDEHGWHIRHDPEGVEGDAQIPCMASPFHG